MKYIDVRSLPAPLSRRGVFLLLLTGAAFGLVVVGPTTAVGSPTNQELPSESQRANAERRRPVAEQTVQDAPPGLLLDATLGRGLLKDEKCMVQSSADPEQWGLRQASREFLIKKGLTASYFDKHFCSIAVKYAYREDFPNRGYGVAWVTYKAMFAPYLTWWQHHFPVSVAADKRPQLRDGTAAIDLSGKTVLVQDVEMREIHRLLPPEDLRRRMQALISVGETPGSAGETPRV